MAHVLLRGKLATSCRQPAFLLPPLSRAFATEQESRVRQPDSAKEYEQDLKNAGATTAAAEAGTVSYFTAAWCGPCRAIAPLIDKLSLEFPHVLFAKLDIDNLDLQSIAKQHEPTFVLHKGDQTLDKIVGADPQRLVASLQKLK